MNDRHAWWTVAAAGLAVVIAGSPAGAVRPAGQEQKADLNPAQQAEGMLRLGQGRWDPWWHKTLKPAAPAEGAAMPEAHAKAGCTAFSTDWQARILPNTAPSADLIGRAVKIVMARNEYEPGCFALHALADLAEVKVAVSPLSGPAGRLEAGVDVRVVEYAKPGRGEAKGEAWAIRLWPAFPVAIPKGFSQEYWVTLKTSAPASKPGQYKGTINVTHASGAVELPIEVTVLDLELRSMNDSFRLGYFDSPYICPGPLTVKDLAEHNMNMHSKWMGGWLPTVKYDKAADKFSFGFDRPNHKEFSEFMKQAKAAGFTGPMFNFLGPPADIFKGNQQAGKLYLERLISPAVGEPVEKGTLSGKMKAGYQAAIRFMDETGKREGWPTQAWTPFDEPVKYVWLGDHVRTKFHDSCKAIQEAGAISFGEIHHLTNWRGAKDCGYVFTKVLDYFCTNNIREDPDRALDKIKADNPKCVLYLYRGGLWTAKTCTARYQAGFYAFAFQAEGTYLWHFTSGAWLGDKPAAADNSGSTAAFECAYGMVPSPAYEAAREAGDDMRYVATYQQAARQKGLDPEQFLGPLRKECRALWGPGGDDALRDFHSTVTDAQRLSAIRLRIAAETIKLMGK